MTHRGASRFNIAAIVLGLAFLYLPIVVLVVFSFNNSRSVAVWGGFSLRWYRAILNDSAMIDAALTSLRIALVSATAATILGTLAAVALTRIGRFRGRLAFSALMYMPLVLPEVIIGLALLLLFVAIDFDRGFWTTALAHTTLTMCFVAAIVQARLIDFDRSLEEAAMDLGCSPLMTFVKVTLPLILPAVMSGWMLAFTLSLDDFVIASFTTGPGATTLPIRIYSEVRLGVKPETNAICTLMIAGVALIVIAASLISKRYAVEDEHKALAAPV
jgi:putrescine transport system permease protein